MNSFSNYLVSLGIYNLFGCVFLLGFLSNSFGNFILTKHLKIFKNSYKIGTSGFLWLVWAAMLNFFFSVVNILAYRWDSIAQMDLLITNIILYIVFVILSILALLSKNYSTGIWFNFPIFLFWICWGLYLILQ